MMDDHILVKKTKVKYSQYLSINVNKHCESYRPAIL